MAGGRLRIVAAGRDGFSPKRRSKMNTRSKRSPLLPLLVLLVTAALPDSVHAQNPAASQATVGQRVEVPGGAYRNISVSELQGMLTRKDFPLINVHIPFQGDLPQTDLSIPFGEIANHLDQLPADKDAPIVLYCRSGNMSTQASTVLAGLGYSRVYNLVGGFNAWKAAGLPMKP
jgi:rhodanese-related sulfurtransferase